MTQPTNKITQLLDSPEWQELTRLQMEWEEEYNREQDEKWNALDYDTKLSMFYSVVKRIVKGELKDCGSYRTVLYDTFGFDKDAYGIGMLCGYMELHNAIYNQDEFKAHVEYLIKKKNQHPENLIFDERPVTEFSAGFAMEKKND